MCTAVRADCRYELGWRRGGLQYNARNGGKSRRSSLWSCPRRCSCLAALPSTWLVRPYVIDHESICRESHLRRFAARHSLINCLQYGDFSAFCSFLATQCAVCACCAADSVLEIGSPSQKNIFGDIGTSSARLERRFGWPGACEDNQVHFRVVCGEFRR
jgi:hypothetical protein